MAVMHLRRDDVVVEEPVVEIETPFPLRKLETEPMDVIVAPVRVRRKGNLRRRVSGWFRTLAFLGLIAIYPALIVGASNVDDRNDSNLVARSEWSAPWAGGTANLIERHYGDIGWASDAPSWAPMGLLTAKPAFQSALAESLGDYVGLVARQSAAAGRSDTDLEAAARLLHAGRPGVQMRAAREALLSHDGRLRRQLRAAGPESFESRNRLALLDTWAQRSEDELVRAASSVGGSPIDEMATVAVYAAKGRATAAVLFIETSSWPNDSRSLALRNAALDAWKAAAAFHPVFVLNGSPDGSIFGNHATSMGFLIDQAQNATRTYMNVFEEAPGRQLASNELTAASIVASSIQ